MGLSLSVTKPRFASPHPHLHIDYHLLGKPHAHSTLGDFTHFSLISKYRIVASTNTCHYSENQLFVKRSQYIRTENPLHKQSEKAKTCH